MKRFVLALSFLTAFQMAYSQKGIYGATPEDSVECIRALSLYYEYYKQDQYRAAIPGWKKAIETCPKSRKSLYIYGPKMYQEFIEEAEKAEDAALKAALLDTLMWIYDKRMEHFGEEGYVIQKKAIDLIKYDEKNPEKPDSLFEKALEMQGMDVEAPSLIYMYKAKYYMYKKKKATKEDMVNLYPRLMDIVDHNVANAKEPKTAKYYQSVASSLDKYFEPFASCDALIGIYQKKFEENPEDIEGLKKIVAMLGKKGCEDSDLYVQVAKKLNELEPSAASAYNVAKWYAAKEDCNSAVEFFKQVVELTDDQELKSKAYISISKCYLVMRSYANTKTFASKALALDGNNAEAVMLIGDAYAYGSSSWGDNACEKKAGYWAAVDKYQRALGMDESLRNKINGKIAKARGQYPSKKDCFFIGLKDGDAYTIGGWINESTTVRVTE